MSTVPLAVIQPVIDNLRTLVAAGTAARSDWQEASKASGTSFVDAFNKSEDSQVKDIRDESNKLTKRLQDLREQARTRLVEVKEISADAARVDELAKMARELRMSVKLSLDALVKSGLITDEKVIAELTTLAEPVLGKPRGRAAAGSTDNSDTSDDSENGDSGPDADEDEPES